MLSSKPVLNKVSFVHVSYCYDFILGNWSSVVGARFHHVMPPTNIVLLLAIKFSDCMLANYVGYRLYFF